MIVLTEQQMRLMETSQDPLRVVNAQTRQTFVLLREDVYEKLCKIVEGANRNDLDSPEMDIYEPSRSKRGAS